MGLFNALGKKHNYKFKFTGIGLLIRLSGRDAQFFLCSSGIRFPDVQYNECCSGSDKYL